MLSIVKSMAIVGIDGVQISVQVDVSNGLPYFEIVGLPDTTVREAKERVRVAIKNSGYDFFSKRIVINLAPADTKKVGSIFDLPIAIGILSSIGIIKQKEFDNYIIIGELSLDGKIKKVQEALAICIEMRKYNIKNIILPEENIEEIKFISGINIYAVSNLKEVADFFNGEKEIKTVTIEKFSNLITQNTDNLDFSDVYGQEKAKRMLEISSAGAHNCLMIGTPGSGKTMLARRITSILPLLNKKEVLEVIKINSLYGEKKEKLSLERPFRAPHYTISASGLIGGGDIPKPGEITLANHGVLFLDELTEFKMQILEMLRTPLEDKEIIISRARAKIKYPTNFILIAAMNPCPCGYYGSDIKECICSKSTRKRYLEKLSGPLLDRFDLFVDVNSVKYTDFNKKDIKNASKIIKERVENARKIQEERYKNCGINVNSELNNKLLEEFCKLDLKSKELLKKIYEKQDISARAYNKIIKVSRTIADLEGKENIEYKHVAEAIQYRKKEEVL